jgi:hypothetical protein
MMHLPSLAGSESPHSVRMKVSASIDSAAVVLDSEAGEVLRAAMENLVAGGHMYPKTLALDLELHAVGVTSPEGTFLRSGAQLMHSSSLATSHHGAHQSLATAMQCHALEKQRPGADFASCLFSPILCHLLVRCPPDQLHHWAHRCARALHRGGRR